MAQTVTSLNGGHSLRIGRAGYDATTRTSRFLQRGQDASAICGAVAGAAVAARLLGLDADRIADAIGIAVSLAPDLDRVRGRPRRDRFGPPGTRPGVRLIRSRNGGGQDHGGGEAAQIASHLLVQPDVLEA